MLFTRLFTGTTTLKRRVAALQDDLADALRAILELEERLHQLETRHESLRGSFHATKKFRTEEPEPTTREERRKLALANRWSPGQPARHEEH